MSNLPVPIQQNVQLSLDVGDFNPIRDIYLPLYMFCTLYGDYNEMDKNIREELMKQCIERIREFEK